MTVYGFRHSFATLMSENGMDKEVLREIMGHADLKQQNFIIFLFQIKERKTNLKKQMISLSVKITILKTKE